MQVDYGGAIFRGKNYTSCEARKTVFLFGIQLNYKSLNNNAFQTSIALHLLTQNKWPQEEEPDNVIHSVMNM